MTIVEYALLALMCLLWIVRHFINWSLKGAAQDLERSGRKPTDFGYTDMLMFSATPQCLIGKPMLFVALLWGAVPFGVVLLCYLWSSVGFDMAIGSLFVVWILSKALFRIFISVMFPIPNRHD